MILADKIIRLRKKNGWSQEELADKMNVSRQAVSKWEGAQTIPDLEKILQLGVLFGVTTDYLLKDEIEDEEFANDNSSDTSVKKITIEEANSYLEQRKRASWQIALATFFCILSPIALIVLSVFLENQSLGVTIGLVALFAFVLCAIPIYIYCGFKNEPYAFLDKNIPFELEYGVKGLVTEAKKKFRNTYVKCNIIAACICIFSPLPLVVSAFSNNETILIAMLSLSMIIAGIGACIFIVVGVQNASMQKLLQEGDYSYQEKKRGGVKEAVGFAYWSILSVVYLAWSFLTSQWHITWIALVVGGVLFPVIMCICNYFADKKEQ